MDSFVVPVGSTYSILARQGYAAQSRRQGGMRHSISPKSETFDIEDRFVPRPSRQRGAPEGLAMPIDMPASSNRMTLSGDTVTNSPASYASSSLASVFPSSASSSTPCSPLSRHFLHERFSSEICSHAIKEDDDDGTIIHNGVKRMSLSEQKFMLQGRPRIVNI
ncbi:hypothetical protein H4R99_001879 [Coemansia sp. RSA 1722]|nr:hypothetical protein IWW45_008296 [Coemansia sp. RSA 485]KAJ2602223.1 hypothetical protein GGF39_000815 [Coemansia sp. RSA 1721]KAJ2604321.1 hypothetical protein H4R99_001879 [Coemansia sp. RSA 1722]KAJ2639429.1 hypothetical protein GGF40_000889 [Coemansia sp. RSA 1286]KAJ2705647.1 hypothetical protein FB645_002242 [Coemansia sp. IMI 203386]